MVKLTVDQIRSQMNNIDNIRNISVISMVDHGKSTIFESLSEITGIEILKYSETRICSEERVVRETKSNMVKLLPLYFENRNEDGSNNNSYLINLMDTPAFYDYQSEVTPALRITDGLMVVVDSIEGNIRPIETVLRNAVFNELLKPVLLLNKVDRWFFELGSNNDDIYLSFERIIENANYILSITNNTTATDQFDNTFSPIKGNVGFGSGLQGWGFTIDTFARIYSSKFGISPDKLKNKLYGENYFNPYKKVWTKSSFFENTDEDGVVKNTRLERGFCQFILAPISKLVNTVMDEKDDVLDKILNSIKVVLNNDELKLKGVQLFKTIMKKWLPFSENVLSMCVSQLPSPIEAQKYRVVNLYDGPMDDECANAISKCLPNGPLMVYISKMIPIPNARGRFYGVGRIFSGTINTEQKVRIMGPSYKVGKSNDLYSNKSIKNIVLINNFSNSDEFESIKDAPCGNIIGLIGIDQFFFRSGTISTSEIAHTIRDMKISIAPVVKVAVEPKNLADLPKLIEAFKRLSVSNLGTVCYVENTGENIVAGAGSQIDDVLLQLGDYLEVNSSEPFLSYRESISQKSSITCLSKSPNRHNRIYMTAEPISKNLEYDIENGIVSTFGGIDKERSKILIEEHGWDISDSHKIWSFGPNSTPLKLGENTNILVDKTKGVQYMNEYKDHFVHGFQWSTREGVLCEEPVKGVRFNIVDVSFFSDAIHRGGGQIIPTSRRVLYASMLVSEPIIMEPWYLVEIRTLKESSLDDIKSLLFQRKGIIIEERKTIIPLNASDSIGSYSSFTVKAHLPVSESFGLRQSLNSQSRGLAFLEYCVYDHYSSMGVVNNDLIPTEKVLEIRKRKGLRLEIPPLDMFYDKL